MIPRSVHEPDEWLVCFPRGERLFWFDWLARGRFKHVCAFGYVPDANVWIHYNVNFYRTVVEVTGPGPDVDRLIGAYLRLGPVLRVKPGAHHRFWGHLAFYCVPAMKHLLGVASGALTPYGLYLDLLAKGAVPFDGEAYGILEPGPAAGRPRGSETPAG